MRKSLILGMTGKARSGKDTAANMLGEELFNTTRKKFIMMAYAHELKLRVQKDFDLSYEQLWGDEKEIEDKRYPKPGCDGFWTPREIMQAYGEFYRTIDNLFWVKNLFNVIDEKEYKNIIITDVRHPNEADLIKEREGFVIKVNREKNRQEIHGSNHASEISMDNYNDIDFHIFNNGTLEDLKISVKHLVELLLRVIK